MTEKLPKHLNPEIWKAALFIDHAEDKQEAADRIEFLLKKKGDDDSYHWVGFVAKLVAEDVFASVDYRREMHSNHSIAIFSAPAAVG